MQPEVMALALKRMLIYKSWQFLVNLKYPSGLLIYVFQTVKYA
jgi:hypothetical protein